MDSEMTSAAPAPLSEPVAHERVAPVWHTVVLLVFLVGVAALDARRYGGVAPVLHLNRIRLYSLSVLLEFLMVGYVWLLGLRPAGKKLRDIIGGRWTHWWEPFRDVGIAFLFWMVVIAMLASLQTSMGVNEDAIRAVKLLAPQSLKESIAWVGVACSAGFCEEIIFRGYLQRQFLAFTGNTGVAIALQAIVFGIAHTYQGWKGIVTIAIYGALFGILAVMRKSLRPGMMQHAFQDSFSGLIVRVLSKYHYI